MLYNAQLCTKIWRKRNWKHDKVALFGGRWPFFRLCLGTFLQSNCFSLSQNTETNLPTKLTQGYYHRFSFVIQNMFVFEEFSLTIIRGCVAQLLIFFFFGAWLWSIQMFHRFSVSVKRDAHDWNGNTTQNLPQYTVDGIGLWIRFSVYNNLIFYIILCRCSTLCAAVSRECD